MKRLALFAVCCAAPVSAILATGCGPYLPAPPSGDGYTYGRVKVPYRSERRGDGFDRAYTRAFAAPASVADGRDPGPRVGGAPGGYRYNEHHGSAGTPLAPASEPPAPPPAEPAVVDAGPEDAGPGEGDGGPA